MQKRDHSNYALRLLQEPWVE